MNADSAENKRVLKGGERGRVHKRVGLEYLGERGWSTWEREVGVPVREGLDNLDEGG